MRHVDKRHYISGQIYGLEMHLLQMCHGLPQMITANVKAKRLPTIDEWEYVAMANENRT
jgi:hypothetical protein